MILLYHSKECKSAYHGGIGTSMFYQHNTIHNAPNVQLMQVSITQWIYKENGVSIHNGAFFSCRKIDHVKWIKSEWERKISYFFFHMWTLDQKQKGIKITKLVTIWVWKPAEPEKGKKMSKIKILHTHVWKHNNETC
jgi:hypothetical protein